MFKVKTICESLGLSRQAYYKRIRTAYTQQHKNKEIIDLVKQERRLQLRVGTRKLYRMLKPRMENMNIKLGRDKFFTLLRNEALLVKRKRSFHRTTHSNHWFRKHPNRIKGKVFSKPEQVWVSDITYVKTEEGHLYLSLITDLYSKKIMGYNLSDNLKTEGCLAALRMALNERKFTNRRLIHHSDRGIQYCSDEYTNLLTRNKIKISMTQSYDPYENAVAERVNGILKDEFSIGEGFLSFTQAQKEISYAIEIYNNIRLHTSCAYLTPAHAHIFGNYRMRSWRRLSTNKHISTKEKRSKKENFITNNLNFN